jgi:DnaJ-class molecular chaperone
MEMLPSYVYTTGNEVAKPKERPEGTFECDGCNGSGVYYGAGSVVNGQFVGFKGKCYRCGGKGHQTKSDQARNRTYDRHRIISP